MTFAQDAINFPSAPLDANTKATVELVANDWLADRDWDAFRQCCESEAATSHGIVNPNFVRHAMTNIYGLTIEPRRYSSFWSRACGKSGFMDATGEWTLNTDTAGGNAGKPIRLRKIRVTA